MQSRPTTTRHCVRRVLATGLATLALAAAATATAPEARADSVVNGCMQDVAGFGLNCTANDVRIAGVATDANGDPILSILDDGCAFPGDTVDFTATFDVLLTAKRRYDIGIYFALDGDQNGDGAKTGTCSITTLDAGNTPNFINLDASPPDTCGDIQNTAANNPMKPTITLLNVACVDSDGDGKLNLPNCVSWRQPGSNEVCDEPADAFPGSPSKCKCDIGFGVPIDVPPARIVVTKTPNVSSIREPGSNVTYTVKVENQGIDPNNPFVMDTLTDNRFGNITMVQGNISATTCSVPQTIAAGGNYTCQFTAFVSGDAGQAHVNVVTAEGEDSRGNSDSDNDDARVTITNRQPIVDVTKTANPTNVAEPGGDVSYTVTVTNKSVTTDPLQLNLLNDDKFGNLSGQGTCNSIANPYPTALAKDATYTCTFTKTISGNFGFVHTNTVTASAVDDEGTNVQDSDSATVNVTNVPSMIQVTKTASPDSLPEPGGSSTYTVQVQNTSAVDDVTIDSLSDDKFGDLNGTGNCSVPQTLSPGASYSCMFSKDLSGNADDSHVNTVTASGKDDDNEDVMDSDDATVNFTDVLPAATLTKTVKSMLVTYEVKVTNDKSAEQVFLTSLVDDKFENLTQVHGDITETNCSTPQTLEPKGQSGDSYTCTFKATVSTSPHTNEASGDVSDDEGNFVEPDPSDTATVSFQ